jgi:hypothetical protein
MKTLGVILIVVGIAMVIIRGVSYTTNKRVLDAGPLHVDKEQNHWLGWPTYAGIIIAVAGVFVVVAGKKASS